MVAGMVVMMAGTEVLMIQTSNLDIILLPTQSDQIHQLLDDGNNKNISARNLTPFFINCNLMSLTLKLLTVRLVTAGWMLKKVKGRLE